MCRGRFAAASAALATPLARQAMGLVRPRSSRTRRTARAITAPRHLFRWRVRVHLIRLGCQSACIVLALGVVTTSRAQPPRLSSIVSAVTQRPELEAFAGALSDVPQLSRDGSRVLVIEQEPNDSPVRSWTILVHASVCRRSRHRREDRAVLFDSRPLQTATRVFVDAVLTPDGRHLVYGAAGAGALATRLPDRPSGGTSCAVARPCA